MGLFQAHNRKTLTDILANALKAIFKMVMKDAPCSHEKISVMLLVKDEAFRELIKIVKLSILPFVIPNLSPNDMTLMKTELHH